jgi:hypothetical protein
MERDLYGLSLVFLFEAILRIGDERREHMNAALIAAHLAIQQNHREAARLQRKREEERRRREAQKKKESN